MRKNVEAHARYYRVKEELTEYIQIGAASLGLLIRNVSVPNGPSLLGGFVDACGVSHWTSGKNYAEPVRKTHDVNRTFSRYAVVQHAAAFDLFSRNIVCDFARFSQWAREHVPGLEHDHILVLYTPQKRWGMSPCCNEMANKIGDLKDRLPDMERLLLWKPSAKVKSIEPLFDLCRMIRNRIVHADSLIGSELETFSASAAVTTALKAFRTHFTRRDAPPLPVFERGRLLDLLPVHAIFFGAVLYEFAKELNDHVCSNMTDGEFIDMAFYYGALADFHSYRTIRHRTAAARVSYFLDGRYLLGKSISREAVIRRLKSQEVKVRDKNEDIETDLWKITGQRHQELSELEKPQEPV
ncbi:MAG: hypothetical protein ABSD31_21980, partial [Candidatus Binataceae bacterium]